MTHAQLIEQAAGWLRKRRHTVIITDMASAAQETPDAIGWGSHHSTLIEAKASRADFLADRHKPWRRDPERGMGNLRYYITVPGVIKFEELPPKWGLLELTAEKIRVRVTASGQACNQWAEQKLLVSAIRRIGQSPPPGLSVACYTMDSKRRATIGIKPEEVE